MPRLHFRRLFPRCSGKAFGPGRCAGCGGRCAHGSEGPGFSGWMLVTPSSVPCLPEIQVKLGDFTLLDDLRVLDHPKPASKWDSHKHGEKATCLKHPLEPDLVHCKMGSSQTRQDRLRFIFFFVVVVVVVVCYCCTVYCLALVHSNSLFVHHHVCLYWLSL